MAEIAPAGVLLFVNDYSNYLYGVSFNTRVVVAGD